MGEETEPTAVAEGVTADESSTSHRRKRKRLLHKSLLELMEFYMGDVNLSHDKFLNEKIQGKPFVYIDLSVFLTFNRVKALTSDITDLVKSLKHSQFLQLSEDETQVCRLTPIKKKENEEDCTIYVEQLGPDVNHDILTKVFSEFGPVDYISLPRYSHSGKFKGFAFIEFRDPECAKKALEALTAKGCCLSPHMAPEELLSVKSFDANDRFQPNKKISDVKEPPAKKENKRKHDSDETAKKPSNEDETKEPDDKEPLEKKQKLDDEGTKKKEDSSVPEEETEEVTEANSTKLQKKRKRKKKLKKDKVTASSLGLRVLSKKEWRQLRNRYLNMQKKVMTVLKQQLSKPNTETEGAKLKEQYKPGTIIKVNLAEPIINITTAKSEFRIHPDICYVDVKEGSSCVYLRTTSPEFATSLLQTKHWPNMELIQGEEEIAYWDKIKSDRLEYFQQKLKPNQRGRTKLLKRAEHFLEKQI
ncbi:la-related protein 7 [Macrosteles quadrilineatus]|uniref:la-related protein 7 n=1 Tax=Macrosteles quadrilineatus TaxID=74068 RepID=UPI0023E0DE8C|nr:la-related protein 7 [Macrosteles quadrilineatus]